MFRRRDILAGATALAGSAAGAALAGPAVAAAPAALAGPGDAAAATLLDQIANRLVAEYPENATYYGIDKGDHAGLRAQLTDRSAIGERARADWAKEVLAKLDAIDRSQLSPARATDVEVTQEAFRMAIAGWRFPFGDMAVLSGGNSFRNSPFVFTQMGGAVVDVPDFLESKHRVESMADADAYLSRLEAYAGELRAETQRFAADQAKGVLAPDFLLDIMQTQRIVASYEPPAKWGVVESLRAKCAAAGLPDRYAARAEAICAQKVMPALDQQMDILRTARSAAWSEPGVWKQPRGEEYYAWALRFATTSNLSPAETHALGLDQLARIQGEMDGLLKAQGLSDGTVGARMTALSKRPDLLFANNEEGRAKLLAYLNGRVADIRTRMPRAFATLVKGDLIIKRVPPAIENGAPNGYASAGSIDGSMPGIYYINLRDTAIWPRYSLPTLTYHEGIPGHVWQGEYANRMPLIRTHLSFNAYTEGWALYAEQTADELGAYDGDPLGRLGYLQSMAFRACRLVVDTGLHAKRWGLDQAVDWFQANTGMGADQIRSEVTRYCAIPGQACGYKMGHNQINQVRSKAQAMLGSRFDMRRFNDAIVMAGNVPLTLLPRIVDRYVASA
jgi:uncharacterized protein (DUF885 family)